MGGEGRRTIRGIALTWLYILPPIFHIGFETTDVGLILADHAFYQDRDVVCVVGVGQKKSEGSKVMEVSS